MIILLFIYTFLIGFLALKTFVPQLNNKFLIIGFSISSGILIESFLTFLLMIINLNNRFIIMSLFLLLLLVLIFSAYKKRTVIEQEKEPEKLNKFILISFIFTLIFAALLMFFHIIKEPEGSWDAMFIWNFRAKFFFVLSQMNLDWRIFYNPVLGWTHLDYPNLLPDYNYVNHLILGRYSNLINLSAAGFVMFSALMSLMGAIKEFRGINNAFIAGIVLLAAKPFLWESMTQCADVFLSLFILSAFIFLFLHEKYKQSVYLFLSYFYAASCSFCKNEGILFFIIFVILSLFFVGNKNKKIIFTAISLPLLCLLYTKLFLFGKSDLADDQSLGIIISNLFNINRVQTILINYLNNLFNFIPLIVTFILAVFTGLKNDNQYKKLKLMLLYLLGFMFIGFFIVYMLSLKDLIWHLTTSSMRLFVQYIPLIIFGIFMLFNCADKKDKLN